MTIPPPPRTPSDEYRRVIASAVEGTRPRRISSELDRFKAADHWRKVPITIGLAVAIISAVAFEASVIERYYSSLDVRIASKLKEHQDTSQPHPYLQADDREQFAKIAAQLGRLNEKIDRLTEATTRVKRR